MVEATALRDVVLSFEPGQSIENFFETNRPEILKMLQMSFLHKAYICLENLWKRSSDYLKCNHPHLFMLAYAYTIIPEETAVLCAELLADQITDIGCDVETGAAKFVLHCILCSFAIMKACRL